MRSLFIAMLCAFSLNAFASIKAVTDAGDVVILNDDGTWVYEDGKPADAEDIPVNPATFGKDKDADFSVKSSVNDTAFFIDPKKWTFKKNENGHDAAEFAFELRNGDLYGLAITEEIQMDVEQLTSIALDNARGAAPDIRVVKKEYRKVNGNDVIYMEMVGTIQSIKFQYLGYYFSNDAGSTQYLTYTSQNLVSKYKTDIDQFLNGLTIQ